MLKAANTSPSVALKIFNGAGVPMGLLVPTPTGYGKSIMDATISFRAFLHEAGVHEYSAQAQGVKAYVPANFVFPHGCVKTRASLYRPLTKKGDPRIWFSRLPHYCKPTDLLAVIAHNGELYVFNMSEAAIVEAFSIPGSMPYDILAQCANVISPVAQELLSELRKIHGWGFIRGIGEGDTSVGRTLESLLGIPPNCSKAPDYKGIELKTTRKVGFVASSVFKSKKVTLFTNTPDWKRSKLKAADLLNTFGYDVDGRRQLYCTVNNVPNPQGLYLSAADELDLINKADTPQYTGDVTVWALDVLKDRLASKHHETFWVQASSNVSDGKEFFRYDLVRHTRAPNVSNMASFFDTGVITLDYALHFEPSGKVRDHGYLFRTTAKHLPLIFPIERIYDLAQ